MLAGTDRCCAAENNDPKTPQVNSKSEGWVGCFFAIIGFATQFLPVRIITCCLQIISCFLRFPGADGLTSFGQCVARGGDGLSISLWVRDPPKLPPSGRAEGGYCICLHSRAATCHPGGTSAYVLRH